MSRRGVNKVILIGNLGKDPETRYTQGGSAITSITLATSEGWMDKDSGEQQERTEWHRVVFFGKLGEIAGEYLRKGSQVYVEGSLRTRKREKDGIERYTTEIVANEMQMIGGRQGSHDDLPPQARQAPRRERGVPAGDAPEHAGGFDAFDDDIPF